MAHREAGLYVMKTVASLSHGAMLGVTLGNDYSIRVDGKFYDDTGTLRESNHYGWRKKYTKKVHDNNAILEKAIEEDVVAFVNTPPDDRVTASDLDSAKPEDVKVLTLSEAVARAKLGGIIDATGMAEEDIVALSKYMEGGHRRSAELPNIPSVIKVSKEQAEDLFSQFDEGNEIATLPEPTVNNPKLKYGAAKAPMDSASNLAIISMQNVMAGGAWKYGYMNYRDTNVDYRTYIGAINRHRMLMEDGVDLDPESRQYHLAHIMACCSILLDAELNGNIIDNRSKTGLVEGMLKDSACDIAEFQRTQPEAK